MQTISEKTGMIRDALRLIEASRDDLPDALARIADFILREPEVAVRASMSDLAVLSGSGEASIARFCRKLGFDGFPAFKIALASDIAYRNGAQPRETDLGTRISDAVRATVDGIPEADLREIADRLRAARHIDIFGSGVSGIVAQLYAYRFSRIGLVARGLQDPVVAEEIAGALDAHSVYMTISETGLTARTERMLSIAGERGAYRVAVSGRRIADLGRLCEKILIATPLSPLPERGELGPVVAKLVLCELLAERVRCGG
ncbi:MurR/RpiR family transcriptional regulator [Celeribacter indicus]|uniref:RpiR family transcriptional regulator n=1 Tax=Celeribacter indicus TaxID=1208324 RepID=A0A0B5E674_9RHOB|nr:MurR/RpiR family transcriptional regulator [Celeribacter indicus]AJE47837.1 RpiR family transcriptional regulator [Celeribacter indicus]SDW24483.1 transcriptional regulator, RpiR family [Celeribacter indicus]